MFSVKDGHGFLSCMKISSFCLHVVLYAYVFTYLHIDT